MASPSGTSSGSGSSSLQNSGSEENLQHVIDQRKRKRMLSNRESARRSRMRKQQHLDDLTGQVTQLRAENDQILNNLNVVTELYLNVESENSVVRAQMCELSHRLQVLNDIINCINSNKMMRSSSATASGFEEFGNNYDDKVIDGDNDLLNPWSSIDLVNNYQPIMGSWMLQDVSINY